MSSDTSETALGCRFYVEVDGMAQAVFTEVSGLTIEMAVEEIEEGGHNDFVHKVPGRCKVSNITLKRGLTNSRQFLDWVLQVAQGTIKPKGLSIVQYATDGTEIMRWNFVDAYPIKWVGPQFRADDKASTIETMELAHKGLNLK